MYPASRGFSLALLLAFTKLFALLVSRLVGLFTPRVNANDFVKKYKPCQKETSDGRVE